MKTSMKLVSASCTLAAAVALVGCGDNTTPPPAPTPTPAPTPVDVAPATTPAMQTVPAAPATMPTTMPSAITDVPTTGPMTPKQMSTTDAPSMANTLIAQGMDYVKNNKLDLAQEALTKLQGMKASLPAEYGPKIDELKTMLDAAQAANGKMPAGMKMPG